MNVALPLRAKRFRELEVVRLLGQYTSSDGVLRPGDTGTIVYRHRGGEAFEVEFVAPFATVVTLEADEIARVDG